jgi:hypothetical protein
MAFHPDNRFPKTGQPVYNGNGEQYDISDPRYAYQDGIDNTAKPHGTSTDNLYSTPEAALARAVQIGCNGYHVHIQQEELLISMLLVEMDSLTSLGKNGLLEEKNRLTLHSTSLTLGVIEF